MWHSGGSSSAAGQARPGVQQIANVRGPAGYGQQDVGVQQQQRRSQHDGQHLLQQGHPQMQQPIQMLQQQHPRNPNTAGSQESVWTMYEQGAKIGEGT